MKKIIIYQDWRADGFCLWNNDFICVSSDKIIKIIELKSGKILKELKKHNNEVTYIKKFVHPIFGECLISQGWKNDGIKLWTYN